MELFEGGNKRRLVDQHHHAPALMSFHALILLGGRRPKKALAMSGGGGQLCGHVLFKQTLIQKWASEVGGLVAWHLNIFDLQIFFPSASLPLQLDNNNADISLDTQRATSARCHVLFIMVSSSSLLPISPLHALQ